MWLYTRFAMYTTAEAATFAKVISLRLLVNSAEKRVKAYIPTRK